MDVTSASTNLEFGSVVMDYYELVYEHWGTGHGRPTISAI